MCKSVGDALQIPLRSFIHIQSLLRSAGLLFHQLTWNYAKPLSKRKAVFLHGPAHFHVSWWEGIGWLNQPLLVGRKLLDPNPNRVDKKNVLPPVLSGSLLRSRVKEASPRPPASSAKGHQAGAAGVVPLGGHAARAPWSPHKTPPELGCVSPSGAGPPGFWAAQTRRQSTRGRAAAPPTWGTGRLPLIALLSCQSVRKQEFAPRCYAFSGQKCDSIDSQGLVFSFNATDQPKLVVHM